MVAIEKATIPVWTAAVAAGGCLLAAGGVIWQAAQISTVGTIQAVKLDALKDQLTQRMDSSDERQKRMGEDLQRLADQMQTFRDRERPNGDK